MSPKLIFKWTCSFLIILKVASKPESQISLDQEYNDEQISLYVDDDDNINIIDSDYDDYYFDSNVEIDTYKSIESKIDKLFDVFQEKIDSNSKKQKLLINKSNNLKKPALDLEKLTKSVNKIYKSFDRKLTKYKVDIERLKKELERKVELEIESREIELEKKRKLVLKYKEILGKVETAMETAKVLRRELELTATSSRSSSSRFRNKRSIGQTTNSIDFSDEQLQYKKLLSQLKTRNSTLETPKLDYLSTKIETLTELLLLKIEKSNEELWETIKSNNDAPALNLGRLERSVERMSRKLDRKIGELGQAVEKLENVSAERNEKLGNGGEQSAHAQVSRLESLNEGDLKTDSETGSEPLQLYNYENKLNSSISELQKSVRLLSSHYQKKYNHGHDTLNTIVDSNIGDNENVKEQQGNAESSNGKFIYFKKMEQIYKKLAATVYRDVIISIILLSSLAISIFLLINIKRGNIKSKQTKIYNSSSNLNQHQRHLDHLNSPIRDTSALFDNSLLSIGNNQNNNKSGKCEPLAEHCEQGDDNFVESLQQESKVFNTSTNVDNEISKFGGHAEAIVDDDKEIMSEKVSSLLPK